MKKVVNAFSFVTLQLLVFAVVASCDSHPSQNDTSTENNTFLQVAEFAIPRQISPEKQLSFALSSTDSAEKVAALQAIEILFPRNRFYIGLAELELAYLQLGSDYRLATEKQRRTALKHYESIATRFSDLPDISAKASIPSK